MTTQEFSNEFDVLYNNIMSNLAPGLDEYEKSVFLTKALNEIVKNYFNPKGNKFLEGFDGSNKRQYDFSSIIRTELLFNVSSHIDNTEKLDSRSVPFLFPANYFLVVNELITDSANKKYVVIPISYDTYSLNMSKPYQYPLKRQAWRMFTDKKNFNYGYTEVIYLKNSESGNKKAPVIVLSSYASDKRLLKFNLKLDSTTAASSYYIKLTRVRNDYDLEEVDCTVYSSNHIDVLELQLQDLKNLIVDAAKKGTSGEVYNGVLIDSKVNVTHWDYFELFDFPNRIEIGEVIPTPKEESDPSDLKLLFSVSTELLYRTIAEIIGRFDGDIKTYFLRYVKTPNPIITTPLPDNLLIEGISNESECELPVEIHPEILQRAVELAKAAYTGDINSTIEMGKRSE